MILSPNIFSLEPRWAPRTLNLEGRVVPRQTSRSPRRDWGRFIYSGHVWAKMDVKHLTNKISGSDHDHAYCNRWRRRFRLYPRARDSAEWEYHPRTVHQGKHSKHHIDHFSTLLLLTHNILPIRMHANHRVTNFQQHPEFEELGVQVAVVDYSNVQELRYTLRGLDLIVSTIAGNAQLNLIHAARHARVRTFVPSEFEGALAHRPTSDDPLDHGSCAALRLLSEFSQQSNSQSIFNSNSSSPSNPPSPPPPPPLHYTVFSCGVFYERFQPGGLGATLNANIGAGSNVHVPGSFLLNADTAEAEIVPYDTGGRPAVVSMTSLYDVARFVAAAIEVGPERWPRELRMRGDRLAVTDVVSACITASQGEFLLSAAVRFETEGPSTS